MCAETAAMRLPVTATSIVPLMLFAGSITRPPRSTMSYCCAKADTHRKAIRPTLARMRCIINQSATEGSDMHRTKISRRRLFQTGGAVAAGLAAGPPTRADAPNPNVYTRIGVRPFINCTATLTINGGSLTFPEVIEAMEQAAHFHVNLEELMEKAGG